MNRLFVPTLMLPVLLAGCGWLSIEPRRPATTAPAQPPGSTAPVETPAGAPAPQSITVQPGDTIYSLAKSRNVPMRALIAANNLQPPYAISPGRTLMLPPTQATHMVKPGDTLYAISRQYGVDATAVAKANGLQPPFGIQAGQPLLIPGTPASTAEARPAPPPGYMPPPRSIDPRPDAVAVETLPLSSPTPPRPTAPPEPVAPPEVSAVRPLPTASASPGGTPTAPPPAPSVPPPAPVVASAPAPASAPADPPARSGRGFLRPVSGAVVTPFGPRPGGLHNDGINIAVPKGTPVRAADAGTVAYAGNELPGYGNLVLIKHADGWVSAYGHNDELIVKRGQTVKRGDTIAKAGATGNVSRPQVHFELRRGARAVDPTPYLSSDSAGR